MVRWLSRRSRWAFGSGLCSGLLVGVGMLVGALATSARTPAPVMPPIGQLNAYATHGGDTFAMATGVIAEQMEGVFFLDFLTGELQCWVPNPRTGMLGGVYRHNVINDLGIDLSGTKKPHFLMVTGSYALRTGFASTVKPADCILYIADANSGGWVAYAIPWDRTVASAGAMQAGKLVKIGAGKARELAVRE